MARIVGNGGGSGGLGASGSGSGVARQRAPFGRVTIVADADGDIIYLPITALMVHNGQLYQGIFAQAAAITGGTVQIDTTLVEPDLALNHSQDTPAAGEPSHWHPDTTVAVGNGISKLTTPVATALRITFAKKGTMLFLAGV